MKKFLLFVISFVLGLNCVYASTNTFERTEDNLRISDDIVVTDDNRDNILATPSVDESEKIYDFAELLSEDEENQLYNDVIEYINLYHMDMVIVTTNSIHTSTTREYGMDFYDYNNFGTDTKHSGILLVIDMNNRRYEMVTSGEAILMYDDDRVDYILDYIFDDVKNQQYFNAMDDFIARSGYYANMGLPASNNYGSVDEFGNVSYDMPIPFGKMLIGALVITIIVMIILVAKNKMVKKATTAKVYLDNDSIVINDLEDILINKYVDKVKIERDSGSSGGFSRGSSTSRGSSGRSHGGGGRSF